MTTLTRTRTRLLLAGAMALALHSGGAAAQLLATIPAGNSSVGGLPPGADLVRFWLTGPDVLCNDGTTPAMYLRRAANALDADKWIVYLEGGGDCGDGTECLQRWKHVSSNYGIQKMSTSVPQAVWNAWHPAAPGPQGWPLQGANYQIPPSMAGQGIFNPGGFNPFSSWNQVFVYYCTSDIYTGTASNRLLTGTDTAGNSITYQANFRGATVFDAVIDQLRSGTTTYCLDDECRHMPDLDNASILLLAGSSGGANGVKHNLDRLRDELRVASPSVEVRGVIDAAGAPFTGGLPWPTTAPAASWEEYVQSKWTNAYLATWSARVDDTCLSENPAAVQYRCGDPIHVMRHHVTTPFFHRMDELDSNGLDNYQEVFYPSPSYAANAAEALFARDVSRQLDDFGEIARAYAPRYANELAAIAADPRWLPPGVYGPRCGDHVGLIYNRPFFAQFVMPPPPAAGMSYADALFAWVTTPAGGILGGGGFVLRERPGAGLLPPPHCN